MALTAVELLRLDQIMNQPYRLTGGSLVDDILEISKLLQKDFRQGEARVLGVLHSVGRRRIPDERAVGTRAGAPSRGLQPPRARCSGQRVPQRRSNPCAVVHCGDGCNARLRPLLRDEAAPGPHHERPRNRECTKVAVRLQPSKASFGSTSSEAPSSSKSHGHRCGWRGRVPQADGAIQKNRLLGSSARRTCRTPSGRASRPRCRTSARR
ncbi:hypothetical protein DMC30DRAFT_93036 [Rhodotorula diobovata]|uniref:Uncharacterized protein n=1 Tax=Rhodotorula diobovata TaxID=5288 RepID=A0A5C5FLN5_9BASI|nr:hypothetical protein DMC30DRAFT_93036 [Rhodotorula diobovata]